MSSSPARCSVEVGSEWPVWAPHAASTAVVSAQAASDDDSFSYSTKGIPRAQRASTYDWKCMRKGCSWRLSIKTSRANGGDPLEAWTTDCCAVHTHADCFEDELHESNRRAARAALKSAKEELLKKAERVSAEFKEHYSSTSDDTLSSSEEQQLVVWDLKTIIGEAPARKFEEDMREKSLVDVHYPAKAALDCSPPSLTRSSPNPSADSAGTATRTSIAASKPRVPPPRASKKHPLHPESLEQELPDSDDNSDYLPVDSSGAAEASEEEDATPPPPRKRQRSNLAQQGDLAKIDTWPSFPKLEADLAAFAEKEGFNMSLPQLSPQGNRRTYRCTHGRCPVKIVVEKVASGWSLRRADSTLRKGQHPDHDELEADGLGSRATEQSSGSCRTEESMPKGKEGKKHNPQAKKTKAQGSSKTDPAIQRTPSSHSSPVTARSRLSSSAHPRPSSPSASSATTYRCSSDDGTTTPPRSSPPKANAQPVGQSDKEEKKPLLSKVKSEGEEPPTAKLLKFLDRLDDGGKWQFRDKLGPELAKRGVATLDLLKTAAQDDVDMLIDGLKDGDAPATIRLRFFGKKLGEWVDGQA
ncbi:hypothetical protein JCM11641_000665 [Rhodosporidiobolus odoratus]